MTIVKRALAERELTPRMFAAIYQFSFERGITIDSFIKANDVGKKLFVGTRGDGEIGLEVKTSRREGDTSYRRFLNAANGIVRETCWIYGEDSPDKKVFPSLRELDECLSDKVLEDVDEKAAAIIIGALFGFAEVKNVALSPLDLRAVEELQMEIEL